MGNLADKYRENFPSISSDKTSNEFSGDSNLKPIKKDINHIVISHLSFKRGHWANRDFSEYKEVA